MRHCPEPAVRPSTAEAAWCQQPEYGTGVGDFATGQFRCGKIGISNACKISRSILRPLCKINLCQNLATLAHHHPALLWLGFSFLWLLL